MSLAATATMVLMLLLLAGFWIIQTGLLAGLEFTEQKVEVVADLHDDATAAADRRRPGSRSSRRPRSRRSTLVTKDEALERFRARLATQGEEDLTRYLDANPLHPSLEVKLRRPERLRRRRRRSSGPSRSSRRSRNNRSSSTS